MSRLTPSHWSLEIFQMSSRDRQQRTLEAFKRIAIPGVHALGVDRGDDVFLIVDASSLVEEIRSRRVVTSIDPVAVSVQSARPRLYGDRPAIERKPARPRRRQLDAEDRGRRGEGPTGA